MYIRFNGIFNGGISIITDKAVDERRRYNFIVFVFAGCKKPCNGNACNKMFQG
jgi:hypothetical protein